VPLRWFFDGRSSELLEHSELHFHVDFQIDVSGIDVGVSQPIAYYIHIVACPQKMHGGGMSDRVWAYGFGCNGWAFVFSFFGVF
jgi:hypothetical protein